MNNEEKILEVIEDKEFLKELNISEEDIFKAIKMAIEEYDELQKLIDEERIKGTTFKDLYEKLKGHNGEFDNRGAYSHNYFDLNYKSLLVTITEDSQNNQYKVDRSDVYIYPNNISEASADELFILNLKEPIKIDKFIQYINEDTGKILLKDYYSEVKDVNNTYMIVYALEAGNDFGLKYIRKGKLNEENLQKVLAEGKDMINDGIDCSKFKIAIFNSENSQFICSYSLDLNNLEKSYNLQTVCKGIELINLLDSYNSILRRMNLEKLCNNEILGICERNDYKSIDYIPNIEQFTKINSSKSIKEKEMFFEDGILIENGVINALITLDAGQIEKNFGLKELNYDEDYYDAYLDYDSKNDSCEITIVAVTDDDRQYYTYLPKPEEKEMLKESLEGYVKAIEGKSIQDLLAEEEELEQE